jgi:restriction endonuclease Mrr
MAKPTDEETLDLLAALDAEFGKKDKGATTARSGSFPPYAEIEDPLLCLILFRGGPAHEVRASDTYRPLADFFGLSDSERREVLDDDTGRSKWNNMVQWARRTLKKRGFLAAAAHGVWRLSDKGVMAAQRVQHKYNKLK